MTTMRVIVATDGSAGASAAVQWARALPLPPDTAFLVVSAVPPPVLPALPDWETQARHATVLAARAALEGAAGQLGGGVERRLLEGDPREAIIAAATDGAADLVVVGARGLGAVKEFFLGSVSIGVARHAPCPVLVCKGAPRSVGTITIAHDGSPGAHAALAFVAALPLPPATRLQLLGVAASIHIASTPAILGATHRQALARAEEESRRLLEAALTREVADLRATVPVEVAVSVGNPAPTILQYAHTTHTDLLVVGARGLGPMQRLAVGSVSESVLRHADCPVLIVRR